MGEEGQVPNLEIVRPLTSDQPLSECWCGGKGATGLSVTQQGQKVFDHFCVCDAGEKMKKTQDDANAVRRLVGRGNMVDRLHCAGLLRLPRQIRRSQPGEYEPRTGR